MQSGAAQYDWRAAALQVMLGFNSCLSKSAMWYAVFHAGPSVKMHWFDTTGKGSYKDAGTRPGADSMNGNAVMYDAVKGKILTMGGATAYQDAAAHATAAIITLTGMTATTKSVSAMKYARAFAMAVVLPDGKTVVIGGQPLPVPFTDTDAVLVPGVRLCVLQ